MLSYLKIVRLLSLKLEIMLLDDSQKPMGILENLSDEETGQEGEGTADGLSLSLSDKQKKLAKGKIITTLFFTTKCSIL